MKKITRLFIVTFMLLALISGLIITNATPVDVVFKQFATDNSDATQILADAYGVKLFTSEDTNTVNKYDSSTYSITHYINFDEFEKIFGDMHSLSQAQIEENLKTIDLEGRLSQIPTVEKIMTFPNSYGNYRTVSRYVVSGEPSSYGSFSTETKPLGYTELEDIITSTFGNIDITYFTFVNITNPIEALYFKSDKGNYFIQTTSDIFGNFQKGTVYTQYEYLVKALDNLYYKTTFSSLGQNAPTSSVDASVPISGSDNSSDFGNPLSTGIAIALTPLILLLLVSISKIYNYILKK